MPSGSQKGAFLQGYNAQAAVDSQAQVIVAVDVIQHTTDNQPVPPAAAPAATTAESAVAFSTERSCNSPPYFRTAARLGEQAAEALGNSKEITYQLIRLAVEFGHNTSAAIRHVANAPRSV